MVKTKYNTNKKKKEKIGKYKKVYVPSSLGSSYNPELVNKLSSYCSLIGIDRTKFISEVLSERLEGLIVTNDFITLEKPFYINWQELEEKRIVKATVEKPIQDLEETVVVKKVPNNLDLFNEDFSSYCYEDNSKLHRGLFIYPKPVFIESTLTLKEVLVFILYFNYNIEANELDVSLVDFNKLNLYINLEKQAEVYETIFNDFSNYVENIVNEEGDFNFEVWTSTFEILEDYTSIKTIEDSIATNSGFIEEVKKLNPNAKITSSTSKDLIKYMEVIFKKERSSRLNNKELQQEIKARSIYNLIPEEDIEKFKEANPDVSLENLIHEALNEVESEKEDSN